MLIGMANSSSIDGWGTGPWCGVCAGLAAGASERRQWRLYC